MTTTKDTGLAAIAASTRKPQVQQRAIRAVAEEKPKFEITGQRQKTSVTVDDGVMNYLADLAHLANRRTCGNRRGLIGQGRAVEAAVAAFHELPLEEQLALICKHSDR